MDYYTRKGKRWVHHIYLLHALAHDVLVVASINRPVRHWRAYIGAVKGANHNDEWEAIADHGRKLPGEFAALIFPNVAKHYIYAK